ncbi:hypothetical protein EOM39_02225 [Candidatus Gracilibacteria bacterium]|nr:hypothetical protein [Candidatus Gracilibacteria bacterium]
MDFGNLKKEEIKGLLKDLKSYSNLTKKLGYRGKRVFDKIKNDKSYFLVEYYPYADVEYVFTKSMDIYKRFFDCSPARQDIVFSPKKSLLGGMKVYMDDNMVDLSFEKVEKTLKK